MSRCEFTEGTSNKVWEIALQSRQLWEGHPKEQDSAQTIGSLREDE